jgi:hypothetical protein
MAHSIYNTALLPYLIADRVVSDYIKNTKVGMEEVTFERYSTFLEHKAERMFDTCSHFRTVILQAKDERKQLSIFMEHWLHSEVNKPIVPLVQIEMFNVTSQLNLFS